MSGYICNNLRTQLSEIYKVGLFLYIRVYEGIILIGLKFSDLTSAQRPEYQPQMISMTQLCGPSSRWPLSFPLTHWKIRWTHWVLGGIWLDYKQITIPAAIILVKITGSQNWAAYEQGTNDTMSQWPRICDCTTNDALGICVNETACDSSYQVVTVNKRISLTEAQTCHWIFKGNVLTEIGKADHLYDARFHMTSNMKSVVFVPLPHFIIFSFSDLNLSKTIMWFLSVFSLFPTQWMNGWCYGMAHDVTNWRRTIYSSKFTIENKNLPCSSLHHLSSVHSLLQAFICHHKMNWFIFSSVRGSGA